MSHDRLKIIGIDNGLDGGIAALEGDFLTFKTVMPVIGTKGKGKREYDATAIAFIIKNLLPDYVIIEKAQAFRGQGVTSTFNTGKGFGIMLGILSAMAVRYEVVTPRTWQKDMFHGLNVTDTKQCSEIVAKRLWPSQQWTATPRSKKAHDGMTDAALIAEYGRRLVGRNQKYVS